MTAQQPMGMPLFASLQPSTVHRSISAPGLKPARLPREARIARDGSSPMVAEQIAFGSRAPLPPSVSRSSVEYFAMGKPPPAYLAMTQPVGLGTPGLIGGTPAGRPPRTAPSQRAPPPLGELQTAGPALPLSLPSH